MAVRRRWSFLLPAALLLACGSEGEGTGRTSTAPPDSSPCGEVQIEVVNHPDNALIAYAEVVVQTPCAIAARWVAPGRAPLRSPWSGPAVRHRIPLVRMVADASYTVELRSLVASGEIAVGGTTTHRTGTLPFDPPPWRIETLEADRVQPGLRLMGLQPLQADPDAPMALYLGMENDGAVSWYYENAVRAFRFVGRDIDLQPDGSLLISTPTGYRLIAPDGQSLWDITPTALRLPDFHHEGQRLPNGDFLTLVRERRAVSDPTLRRQGYGIQVGDRIVQISGDAELVWEWSTFDHLDTGRMPAPIPRSDLSVPELDWTRANAVVPRASDGSLLLSLGHQSWIVKIDHGTGEVLWRLGEGGDFALTEGTWFRYQHGPEWIDGDRLLVFDNHGADWADPQVSRAVIYRIDEAARTARQEWAYPVRRFNGFLGDADRLPNGNLWITAGGGLSDRGTLEMVEVTPDPVPRAVWRMELEHHAGYRSTCAETLGE